jgi:hypothetical protein
MTDGLPEIRRRRVGPAWMAALLPIDEVFGLTVPLVYHPN